MTISNLKKLIESKLPSLWHNKQSWKLERAGRPDMRVETARNHLEKTLV